MGNKLRDTFNNADVKESFNITFNTPEDRNQFKELIEGIWAGKITAPKKVEGIKNISRQIIFGEDKYSLPDNEVRDFVIGPSVENVPITLEVNGRQVKRILRKTKTNEAIILSYSGNPNLQFIAKLDHSDLAKIEFTINIKQEKIRTVKSMVEVYEELIALFSKMLANSSRDNSVVKIQKSLDFWKRVQLIEKEYALKINPHKDSEASAFRVDKLALLREGYAIKYKQPEFKLSFSIDEWEETSKNLHLGSETRLVWNRKVEFELYGNTISEEIGFIIPRAQIVDINKDSSNEVVATFNMTDEELSRIEFLAKEGQVPSEVEGIISSARGFWDLCSEKYYLVQA